MITPCCQVQAGVEEIFQENMEVLAMAFKDATPEYLRSKLAGNSLDAAAAAILQDLERQV